MGPAIAHIDKNRRLLWLAYLKHDSRTRRLKLQEPPQATGIDVTIAGLDAAELIKLALLLVAVGALAGFLAGVFGIGGGAVLVPVFYECFRLAGVPLEVRMPLCVGTSLAVIIPTSISSFRAHYLRGAVDMDILKI
jgi:uncharacterized protein